jgi:hypothetical protein
MDRETLRGARERLLADATLLFAPLINRGYRVNGRGLRPRMSVNWEGEYRVSVDFWPTVEDRYEDWDDSTRFDLGGAAGLDREEEGETVRYWKPFTLYVARPYAVALTTLQQDVREVARVVESWSRSTLLTEGARKVIGRRD